MAAQLTREELEEQWNADVDVLVGEVNDVI